MDETKRQLLAWIDADRDRLITFLSQFVQAKSPNPPGDTREAAAHITRFLEDADLPYRIIDPKPEFPNIVASFEGGAPGKHLVLNGHIDCFPAGEHEMVGILQANARTLSGTEPQPICSLGGTDARLWRAIGVPAYVYGPFPTGMGTGDEHVPIEDFLHIVRTHVLSAYDYLSSH